MNLKCLTRLYDRLTAWERLPLLRAARERGDTAEVQRLARSAPRRAFTVPDYYGLAEGVDQLAQMHALCLLERVACYWRASGWLRRGHVEREADAEDSERSRHWVEVARMWAYLFTVEARAWEQLMVEMHLDPEALLRDLPGYETLRQAGKAIPLVAFTEEEAAAYLRRRNPQARPPTVETIRVAMREFLESCLKRWD